jgi:glutamine---fructose-6-phosphate transaminase (isomerizing)
MASRMLEEIRQQPTVLEKTLREGWRTAEKLRAYFAKNRPRMIVLAARGTSDNAAQFGRYLLEIETGIPVSLSAPSIYTLYKTKVDLKGALVVAISQSGESTDTNYVLEQARRQGAMTVGITNEAGSTLAGLGDFTLLVRGGREKSVAATKTYTGQMMAMYLLAWALGAPLEQRALESIPGLTARMLTMEKRVAERAERYRFMEHGVVVGRGLNYANALEFALKMMETCYVVAERFSTADFLHGPIAMVEAAFPVFAFAPAGPVSKPVRELVERLEALQADTMVITDPGNAWAAKRRHALVAPMKMSEEQTAIPYIIPAQLFAACLAEVKGLNPDQPRTLTKVTRTM